MSHSILFFILFCAILAKCECAINNFTFSNNNALSQLPRTDPRIVGGKPATIEGTRHMVSIRLKHRDSQLFGAGHTCGGSVINSSLVLTAAHCFYNQDKKTMRTAKEFVVVMGTLNRYTRTSETLQFNVKRIHYHPQFNINTLVNDIGTMIIDGSIPQNHSTVQRIQLSNTPPKMGEICRVDGWGAIKFHPTSPTISIALLTINIRILDTQLCRTTNGNIRAGMFCAGVWAGGKDSCQGDSGGPLTCGNRLVGVVSFGNECGNATLPGIYTDVYYFRNWIDKNSASSLFQFKIIFVGIFLIFSKLFFI